MKGPDKAGPAIGTGDRFLEQAAAYGTRFRRERLSLHPEADVGSLRRRFCRPLAEEGQDGEAVIRDLIAAAEPGLVGNTDGRFFAWVMGASHPVGVAADWLTSVWGQNAAIYQTSPAAAIAEEAVAAWLLDLLDLPRDSGVGLVTGATMAGFVCLAAARAAVLDRAGYDLDRLGLQGAPRLGIFLSDDVHVSNLAALRYLGFGEANLIRIPSDGEGMMPVADLATAMAGHEGPKIVIGQAGHINSGGFEDFAALADLAQAHGAWLHVDGAFGLWARVLPEKAPLTVGLERADSWSVDGHKWLQIPYDSGFAIVRDAAVHRRAMAMEAAYLTRSPEDGRNPSEFNPELSRRARGFAAWAVLQSLGRAGVRDMVRHHCELAQALARRLTALDGLDVLNRVVCNQIVLTCHVPGADGSQLTRDLAERLNATNRVFVRTAFWKGAERLRLSVISGPTGRAAVEELAACIAEAWATLKAEANANAVLEGVSAGSGPGRSGCARSGGS